MDLTPKDDNKNKAVGLKYDVFHALWGIIVLGAGVLLYYLIYLNDGTLPKVITLEDIENNPNLFSGERSRDISVKLQALGPRIVGNYLNEVAAPKIVEDDVDQIIENAHPAQKIERDRQLGSGSYLLTYRPPFVNIYDEIQNVIVRVQGSEGNHSILVNCHYDSVPTSDGAADDAISCTAMLEIIRVLSVSPTRLKHNVVFLFNGAEETLFQAAHLFLDHAWASTCRLVLNLEAAGLGGRNILFQSGPMHPWIFKYYARHAKYPHGQVLGEEMFQRGVIPSDSDFRIFRDFGGMVGMDFAFWRDGYIYHTKYDTEKYMPIECHQNLGDNTLALVKAFGDAPELDDMEGNSEGQMVYYDYLGWFMISYSATANIILNSFTIVFSIASMMVFLWMSNKQSMRVKLFGTIIARILGMLVAIGVIVVIALVIDGIAGLVMPWYSNPWLIFPFYWCPCLITLFLIQVIENHWRTKKSDQQQSDHEQSDHQQFGHQQSNHPQFGHQKSDHQQSDLTIIEITQMDLIAVQVPGLIILLVSTIVELRSSSLFFLPVLSSAVANLVIHLTPLHRKGLHWVWVYILIHIPSLAFSMYIVLMCHMFFIPIFGRNGTGNDDLTMAILTGVFLFYMINFAIPLMNLVKKPIVTICVLWLFSIIVIILSLTTDVGHPYKVDLAIPKPQRYWIMHTHREFRDMSQNVRRNETGYFVYNQDRNSPRTLPLYINESLLSVEEDCQNELYCGLPMYSSRMVGLSTRSNWIPAGFPNIPERTELILESNRPICDVSSFTCDLNFILLGPDRMTLTFVPYVGASLFAWSLDSEMMNTGEWQNRPTYLLHICRGSIVNPFTVSLRFNVTLEQLNGAPILDIGLTGNHIHHDDMRTEEFTTFLNRLPEWTQITSWISVYKFYVF